MLSGGTWNRSLLHLAESSAAQRVVVEGVVPDVRLHPANSESEENENTRWVTILQKGLLALSCCHDQPQVHQFPLQLFQAPQLRKADIMNYPPVMSALANCTSLRTLRVVVMYSDLDVLWLTLRSLEIESLEICCDMLTLCNLPDSECPFVESEHFTSTRNLLSEVCPNLKALIVDCCDCSYVADERMFNLSLWHMYRSLPSLRETTLWIEPPEYLIPQLREMESVAFGSWLILCKITYNWAIEIGAAMKEVHALGYIDEDKLSELLSSCPNLSHLTLEISFGAERTLLDATHVLANLRLLHLSWEDRSGCRHGEPRCGAFHCYRGAAPGVLLSIVQAAVRVSELELKQIDIPLSEIRAILENLGDRLVKFDMSVYGQSVPQYDYLEALLCYAAMYNPNFRSFAYNVSLPPHAVLEAQQGRRLLAGMARLRRTAPSIENPWFIRAIEAILNV